MKIRRRPERWRLRLESINLSVESLFPLFQRGNRLREQAVRGLKFFFQVPPGFFCFHKRNGVVTLVDKIPFLSYRYKNDTSSAAFGGSFSSRRSLKQNGGPVFLKSGSSMKFIAGKNYPRRRSLSETTSRRRSMLSRTSPAPAATQSSAFSAI